MVNKVVLCKDCHARPVAPHKQRCHQCHAANENHYASSRYGSSRMKKIVVAQRGNKCERCGSTDRIVLHHKTRVLFGGLLKGDNLILLCHYCHSVESSLERGGASLYQGA